MYMLYALAIGIAIGIEIPYYRYYGESISIVTENKLKRWDSYPWNTSIYITSMGIQHI